MPPPLLVGFSASVHSSALPPFSSPSLSLPLPLFSSLSLPLIDPAERGRSNKRIIQVKRGGLGSFPWLIDCLLSAHREEECLLQISAESLRSFEFLDGLPCGFVLQNLAYLLRRTVFRRQLLELEGDLQQVPFTAAARAFTAL